MATTAFNLSGGGVFKAYLLWTNTNTNVPFPEQTVSLDLSKYEYVAVDAKSYLSSGIPDSVYSTTLLKVGDTTRIANIGGGTTKVNTNVSNTRSVYATYSGVVFENGRDSSTITGKAAIPLRIYGIKRKINGLFEL